ncbi:MAG: hypothetical protein ABIL25_06140 [candidate division WOR-3 bacterium]
MLNCGKKLSVVVFPVLSVVVPGGVLADGLRLPHEPPPNPSFGIIVAEAGGAVVVGAVAGAGLGVVCAASRFPARGEGGWLDLSGYANLFIGGVVGYTVGTPIGVAAVGAIAEQQGAFLPGLLGSTAGTAVTTGLLFLGMHDLPLLLAYAALPPAGAVIGYNLSRSKYASMGFNSRLGPPELAVKLERLPDNSSRTTFDARLVNVRF